MPTAAAAGDAWQPAQTRSGTAGPVIGSVGELLVEFVCTEQGGRHLRTAAYTGPFPSGAPGIFIDQAARIAGALGGTAVFCGAVGDDAFGQVLTGRLRASGVDLAMVKEVAGVPTGSAFVSYNPDGSRDFVFNIAHSAAARFKAGKAAADGFAQAGTDVLHVSGSSLGDRAMRDRVQALCTDLKARGVALSVDPNIRPELMADAEYLTALRTLIAMADYVLPSDADAAVLWPGLGFDDWGRALLGAGARGVALKQGAGGAAAMDGTGLYALPGHAVAVVDPTGAGDCFCATFVTLLAAGRVLPDALSLANAAGALAVTRLGPMEGNSTLDDIARFLNGR